MRFLFKKLTYAKDKKRLFENFVSLSGLQVFTYVLPLITLPYLVRILGVEKYGLVMFSQSLIMFFMIFVDYGFNLSATREIAVNRESKEKVTEIYSSVITIKVFLVLLSFFILLAMVFSIERFTADAKLYLLTFLMVIGHAFFPLWYFQGMEKMRYITIINILSRVLFTAAIFLIVRHEDDYLLVPLFNGLGVCAGSVYALWIIRKDFNQKIVLQKFDSVLIHFKDSTQFFLSRASVSLYTAANVLVLGLTTNNTAVGHYSIAEKLFQAIKSLYGPIAQALYPYVAREKNLSVYKKIFIYAVLLNVFGTLILAYFDEFIFRLLFSDNAGQESLEIFNIFLVANLVVVPSILLGYPLLAALGYANHANNSVFLASAFHVVGLSVLYGIDQINVYTVSALVVITELICALYRIYYTYTIGVLRGGK